MKNSRHSVPEVNAGSMADIAFLLLIFFLVTTTISADKGINRKLPENCPLGVDCNLEVNERNILRVSINGNDELFVEQEKISIYELKNRAKAFLDNNGDSSCDYCNGIQNKTLSDNPSDAIISLSHDQNTSYEMYIGVQDILTKSYYELREVYASDILGKSNKRLNDSDMQVLKKAYPFILSEAERN